MIEHTWRILKVVLLEFGEVVKGFLLIWRPAFCHINVLLLILEEAIVVICSIEGGVCMLLCSLLPKGVVVEVAAVLLRQSI